MLYIDVGGKNPNCDRAVSRDAEAALFVYCEMCIKNEIQNKRNRRNDKRYIDKSGHGDYHYSISYVKVYATETRW